MKIPIEGTVTSELQKRIKARLDDLQVQVTEYQLDQREYDYAVGQIKALRWCNEEVKDLENKLL